MSMEHWCNDDDRRTEKYWDRNLSLCHLVHHKSHTNPGLLGERPETNRLSHSTARMESTLHEMKLGIRDG
jgi:hypothetical protein